MTGLLKFERKPTVVIDFGIVHWHGHHQPDVQGVYRATKYDDAGGELVVCRTFSHAEAIRAASAWGEVIDRSLEQSGGAGR